MSNPAYGYARNPAFQNQFIQNGRRMDPATAVNFAAGGGINSGLGRRRQRPSAIPTQQTAPQPTKPAQPVPTAAAPAPAAAPTQPAAPTYDKDFGKMTAEQMQDLPKQYDAKEKELQEAAQQAQNIFGLNDPRSIAAVKAHTEFTSPSNAPKIQMPVFGGNTAGEHAEAGANWNKAMLMHHHLTSNQATPATPAQPSAPGGITNFLAKPQQPGGDPGQPQNPAPANNNAAGGAQPQPGVPQPKVMDKAQQPRQQQPRQQQPQNQNQPSVQIPMPDGLLGKMIGGFGGQSGAGQQAPPPKPAEQPAGAAPVNPPAAKPGAAAATTSGATTGQEQPKTPDVTNAAKPGGGGGSLPAVAQTPNKGSGLGSPGG
jgi:hypothetical protein